MENGVVELSGGGSAGLALIEVTERQGRREDGEVGLGGVGGHYDCVVYLGRFEDISDCTRLVVSVFVKSRGTTVSVSPYISCLSSVCGCVVGGIGEG